MISKAQRGPTLSGNRASQDERELAKLITLFGTEGVTSYGEIGAREGDTFHKVVSSLPAGSRAVAVDLPGAKWGKAWTDRKLKLSVADLVKQGYKASAIFGDSRATGTIAMFRGRGPYDAILIDGDHSFEGVTADWLAYRDMAKIIVFHDIAGQGQKDWPTGTPVDVPALWRSIREGHRTVEFVEAESAMGIGVVWT